MANGQETIIAQGVTVEGDFSSEGDVSIDGSVAGSIRTNSGLRIGPEAIIRADVQAAQAVIAGTVEGNIVIADSLELTSTSHIAGDVQARVLSVAAGAQINGSIHMGEIEEVTEEDAE